MAESRVNTTVNGNQQAPAVAVWPTGEFVLVWQHKLSTGQDQYDRSIHGQVFGLDGTASAGELTIQGNNPASTSIGGADVTVLNDGRFVVVWQMNDQGYFGQRIFCRMYTAQGVPQTGTVLASSEGANWGNPAIVSLEQGGFLVTYNDEMSDKDGSGSSVFARRFDSDGEKVGDEFLVNSTTPGNQEAASATALGTGGFAIGWQGPNPGGGDTRAFFRLYSADGQPKAEEILLNPTQTSGAPSLTATSGGTVTAAWNGPGNQESKFRVFVGRFSAEGVALPGMVQASSQKGGMDWAPSIAGAGDGHAFVAYTGSDPEPSDEDIYGRIYDSALVAVTDETVVNKCITGRQRLPDVAVFDDGRWVVVWQSEALDVSGYGIAARCFGADGTPLWRCDRCGNEVCGSGESCDSCPADCGQCL